MGEIPKINNLNTILQKLWKNGTLKPVTSVILEPVLDWRQNENVAVSSQPCPHGSFSGTKVDCKECFDIHFLNRSVRN